MWANLVLADLAAGKHVDPHDIAIVRWKELTAERDKIVATLV